MIGLVGDHLWQSTLGAVAVALLARAFSHHRAQVRYALWLAASVKFLVPFAALVWIGGQLGWRVVGAPSGVSAGRDVPLFVEIISHPFSHSNVVVPSDSAPLTAMPGLTAALPDVLLTIWVCGSVLVLCAWWTRWRRVAAVVRGSVTIDSGEVLETLRDLEGKIGTRGPVALVSSTTPLEPGVFGIVKPVLLWPDTIADRLGRDAVEAVLAHELCHVRRRDNLAAALQMAIEAVFWFHPLVWWLGTRLVEERERACDEEVIRLGSKPDVYAESILKTCRFYVESPLACVSGVTGSDLKQRIEKIMRHDAEATLNTCKKVLLAATALGTVVIPIAVGVFTAPRLAAQQTVIVGGAQGSADGQIAAPAGARPTFEVASVKPNRSGDGRVGIGMQPGGRFTATNVPLRTLIRLAYQLQDFQIVGAPGWIATDRFDINAKAEGDVPPAPLGGPPGPMQFMMQSLLAERFNLKVHTERRDMPIYALALARNDRALGPQLRPAAVDCAAMMAARRGGGPPPPPLQPGERPQCGMRIGPGQMAGGGFPLSQLANTLSSFVQRVVVDRTELTGTFDLDFTWTPDQLPQGPPPPGAPPLPPIDPNGPSIFTALQEQLGLKLESTRGPVEVLVVDSVSQPTPD